MKRRRQGGISERTAESLARKIEDDVTKRRESLIDLDHEAQVDADRVSISRHLDAYIDVISVNMSRQHVKEQPLYLRQFYDHSKATRLSDISASRVVEWLRAVLTKGFSARAYNVRRQAIIRFAKWAAKKKLLAHEIPAQLSDKELVPRKDESADRRRVHRALTDDAKASREDLVPLHPESLGELRVQRPRLVTPASRVFPVEVSARRRRRHFELAGIPLEDERGRVVDLHACRTTFATRLAREGISPQVARKLLRHTNVETTTKYYTKLTLDEQTAALARLPGFSDATSSVAAVGADNVRPRGGSAYGSAVTTRERARPCENMREGEATIQEVDEGQTASKRRECAY